MLAGRIGSAELQDLVNRRADFDLRIPVTSFGRLAAVAAGSGDDRGTIGLAGSFLPGHEGFPQLRLAIGGQLQLTCQRCLEPVDWPLDLTAQLTIVPSDEKAAALAEPMESVVMPDEGLVLRQVAEDEILAALPLAPMHQGNPPCQAPAGIRLDTERRPGAVDMHRPLAGLADLLGRKKGRDGE